MKKSRTVRPTAGVESPTTHRLPLVELLIDTLGGWVKSGHQWTPQSWPYSASRDGS